MFLAVHKYSILSGLILMISACSSISLDNNASKIQTRPTTTDQRQLIPVYQVDIHENASCDAALKDGKMGAALAAGGHLNPDNTANHGTPENGHLGDLPVLVVNDKGFAITPVTAPRLKLSDIQGRTIMIHAGGDNYSDTPKPLGGGGERIACGVIQ